MFQIPTFLIGSGAKELIMPKEERDIGPHTDVEDPCHTACYLLNQASTVRSGKLGRGAFNVADPECLPDPGSGSATLGTVRYSKKPCRGNIFC
jgi:hypothetical protein